jgi:hypothetical protein
VVPDIPFIGGRIEQIHTIKCVQLGKTSTGVFERKKLDIN